MEDSTSWLAPAKINLFLRITGQRADGMHELQTAFQFIDLCDELRFSINDGSEILRTTAIKNLSSKDDLCVRAAKLLQQHAGVSQGVDIAIKKMIPMGGGLGGASSDAATTLLVLNKLWSINDSVDRLAELGESLGADVPVFIRGQAAWAEGVGEQLTAINMEENWYLVVNAGVHVSTQEMFAHSQLTRNSPTLTICPPKPGEFGNVFEPIVRAQYPKIDSIFDWLNDHSCPFLTGTGGCVVAAFADEDSALKVQSMSPAGISTYIAKGRNKSPLLTQL